MRTQINLATQPYEDAKQYVVRWGTLVAILFVATIGLIWFTVHSVRRSSDINRQLSIIHNHIAALDHEREIAERMLAMPQNRGTVLKSQYLNSILARKAFSWTTVFSDMEKLMPPGLHVVSITPQLDDQNQLQVHIIVGGESRDRALELVRSLEKTPRFRDVTLRSDITATRNNEVGESTSSERDPIKFDIIARYLPGIPNPAAPAEGVAATKAADETAVAQSGGKP
jgi:type IV pilus assembly protein PilN